MIFENDSFPLPLSPVIRTVMSVGATWAATSMAWFSTGALPMMPNRCLMFCISASFNLNDFYFEPEKSFTLPNHARLHPSG